MTLCYSFLKFGKVSTTDLVVPVSFVILYSLHSTSQIQHKLKLHSNHRSRKNGSSQWQCRLLWDNWTLGSRFPVSNPRQKEAYIINLLPRYW